MHYTVEIKKNKIEDLMNTLLELRN